jgi:hypothetical protein
MTNHKCTGTHIITTEAFVADPDSWYQLAATCRVVVVTDGGQWMAIIRQRTEMADDE